MTAAIVAGLGLGLFLSLSVGPVIFAIIKYSINNGFKAGISFALGVSFSDALFVTVGNLSTAFITGLEGYNRTIGICGGILLIGMGLYALIFKKVRISTGEEKPEMFRTHDYLKIWLAGFLMNTLNPGVIIFWLPVCIASSATPVAYRIVLYVTCLALVLSADILKVFVADKIRHKLTLTNVIWLNRIAGSSMVIFGLVLLYQVTFGVGPMGH